MSNNAQQPAFPVLDSEIGAFGSLGLTKLEYAAIQIFQGFCSQPETPDLPPISTMAKNAVAHAVALFAALEAEKGGENG